MKIPSKKLKSKSKDQFKTISDEKGNNIVCKNNGKRVILSLKLVSETKKRRIGVINIATKTIEIKRNRSKHLFIKTNSYGFNHKLLSDSKLFDKVRLFDEQGEWLIPKEYILTNGSFMNFLNKGGFELQIFVTLSEIEKFKKKPKI